MSVAEIRLYLGYTALAVYLALPLLLPAAFVSAALALTDQGRGFLELSAPPSLAYALLLLALVTFTFALGLAIRADRPPEDSAEQRRDYVLHWYASFSGPLIVATIAMYLLPCLIEFFLASGTQIPSRFAELLLGETRLLALLFLTAQLAAVFIVSQFKKIGSQAFVGLLAWTVGIGWLAHQFSDTHFVLALALLQIIAWLFVPPMILSGVALPAQIGGPGHLVPWLLLALLALGVVLAVRLDWTGWLGSAVCGVVAVLAWGAALVLLTLAIRRILGDWRPYLVTFVLLVALSAALVASVFIPAQRVRELAVVPQTPTAAPSSRPPIAAFVRQWVEQRRSEILAKAPYPVFLVAAPGGGIRASYWTAGVLGALQDHDKAFARHVLAISSVSGSSVGAGIFAALVKSGCRSPTDKAAACRRLGAVALSADFLAPPIYALMTRDVVGHPLGLALSDRAAALERAFEQQWRDTTQTDIWLCWS
jgi:hypothetical protein